MRHASDIRDKNRNFHNMLLKRLFLLDYKEEKPPVKVDLCQTVTRGSSDRVIELCVRNFWRHIRILPVDGESEPVSPEEIIQSLQYVERID